MRRRSGEARLVDHVFAWHGGEGGECFCAWLGTPRFFFGGGGPKGGEGFIDYVNNVISINRLKKKKLRKMRL